MKPTKNKIKKERETDIRDEIRGLGVLIEHVDGKVSLIAEQYGDIKKTLGEHTRTLESHTGILEDHTRILENHTRILENHTRMLDSHTEMIGSMMVDIEVIKEDITFIKGGLKQKVDVEEFLALEKRVALLEKRR